jgi:hypothetical protein
MARFRRQLEQPLLPYQRRVRQLPGLFQQDDHQMESGL